MCFPIYNPNQQKGQEGEARFADFVVNSLKCIFHKTDGSNDFGIDGHIELAINGYVTGKFAAVQVKHGDSFFKQKTEHGYKFAITSKHLNYYMNSPVPVYIVIMNNDFSIMRWVKFDFKKINLSGDDSLWIEIPNENNLSVNFKDVLFMNVGPVYDYSTLIKEVIKRRDALYEMLDKFDTIIIGVTKEQVNAIDFSDVTSLFDCLSNNRQLRDKFKTSCNLCFFGYDNDDRELWDIPEVVHWIHETIYNNIPWFYYLSYGEKSVMPLFMRACVKPFNITLMDGGTYFEYDGAEMKAFFDIAFTNLNRYTRQHSIDLKINKEISQKIGDLYL